MTSLLSVYSICICRIFEFELAARYSSVATLLVLEDSYSEVIVNVIDLALNWQLFSDVGRPREKCEVREQYSRS